MNVILARHSLAIDPYSAPSDSSRWLTAAGRERARQVAVAFQQRVTLTHVFMSPLVRAVQTAELLTANLDLELVVHTALAPERGTTAQVFAPLDVLPDDATVLFVGHAPTIGSLAAHACGRSVGGFSPCTVVCAENGRHAFTLDPKAL